MSAEIIAGYTTQSAEETMALGRELAATLPSGIVLLRGDLGAGRSGQGGWREMVCVESGNALGQRVQVAPGATHTLRVEYSVAAL